jgi:ParB family chromosome partitioning protein
MSKKTTSLIGKVMIAANPPTISPGQSKQKPFAASAGVVDNQKPKTGVGRMGAAMIELDAHREQLRERADRAERQAAELGHRVEVLEYDAQIWNEALPVRCIDPNRIKRSDFANRLEESFHGAEFAALMEDIKASAGNVQPIKVRHLSGKGRDEKFEIIYGHRRHQACLNLGLEVRAIVDALSPEAHFLEMLRENQARADLSPFEQGLMYKQAKQVFKIQDSKLLAKRLDVSESQISRAIKLVDLPDEVIAAFPSRLELQYNWATALNKALKKSRDSVLAEANRIASLDPASRSEMTSKAVLQALIESASVVDFDSIFNMVPSSWQLAVETSKGSAFIRQDGEHFDVRVPAAAMTDLAKEKILDLLSQLLK